MKQIDTLLRCYAGAASVLLTLSLFFLAGCSGGSDGGGAKGGGKYGLDQSEYIALKKANRDPKDFNKALLKRRMEDLQEKGVVVETATSRKPTKKPR